MMGYNIIKYAGRVLMDLSKDTVTSDKLLEGYTAHGANGEKITGTMKEMTVTDDGSGNVSISGVAVVVK
jgi:hypothetical protein